MKSLQETLLAAWRLRINRNIEETMVLCSELKTNIHLPPGDYSTADLNRCVDQGSLVPDVIDVAALWASLTRALKGADSGAKLITELDKFAWDKDSRGTFFLHFEAGFSAFARQDYSAALERFVTAASRPAAPWQLLCAEMNAALCLENLGLPREKTEKSVEKLLSRVQDTEPRAPVVAQWDSYRMRTLFRRGQIQAAIAIGDKPEARQTYYYSLWLRSLPFHKHYRPTTTKELALFHSKIFMYRDYRIRSLMGVHHPNDSQGDGVKEFADRIYLWVWKWLADPLSFPVQKLTMEFRHLDLLRDAHRLTVEDTFMIRNTLMWLGLFDPAHERALSKLVNVVQHDVVAGFEFFEIEALTIHYCEALRDDRQDVARDLLAQLKAHPLWNSDELLFAPLVNSFSGAKAPAPLKALSEHLMSSVFPHRTAEARKIKVDLVESKITQPGISRPIYSLPMCAGLELLRLRGSVTIEEFSHACFGISRFDPTIHMSRVYNLLARFKALKGSHLTFRVRGGLVVSEGDWSAFAFLRNSKFSTQLSRNPDWLSFVMTQTPMERPYVLRPSKTNSISWQGLLQRSDVEKLIGRPRSTTNRILNRLVRNGSVIKEGSGRSSRYRMRETNEIALEAQ